MTWSLSVIECETRLVSLSLNVHVVCLCVRLEIQYLIVRVMSSMTVSKTG